MSVIVESPVAAEPPKPLIARVNWVKAAPWLYTLALFAMWELLVYALKMPPTILPSPVRVGQATFALRRHEAALVEVRPEGAAA